MSLKMQLDLQRKGFSLSINTELPASGFNVIYGHSGAGKTTLLRWLAGLEKNTRGQLHFKQQCWQNEDTFIATRQREIGYVFQDARLFPHLTVHGNLHYAYKRRFNNNGPAIEQVCQWFELHPLLEHPTTHLSGGQQQRVAMARALLSSPQLILMDEPLGSLDDQSKEKILQHLEQLHKNLSVPVIYVSHDLVEVSRLADQLVLLDNGRIRAQGSLLTLSSRLDLGLSHEKNAASIIHATVQRHDEHYHLTELSIGDEPASGPLIFLTRNNSQPGDKIRVRIPAQDVSIALHKATDSSILNILPCTIDAIENTADARVLVRLKLANQWLLARLTHKSIDRLQLHVGQQVYAQIKTVALLSEQTHTLLT